MARGRFGLPPSLIWWAIPAVDVLGARLFMEGVVGGMRGQNWAIFLLVTAPMFNVLAVAAVLRVRRGPIRGLAGFLIGGLIGIAIFGATVAAFPEWVDWRLIAVHRAALWMRSDPELAVRAILEPLAKLLGPQVAPALIGLAIDRFRRRRPAVEGPISKAAGVIAGLLIVPAMVAVDCGLAGLVWAQVAGRDRSHGALILGIVGSLPMLNALGAAEVLRRLGRISARSAVGFLAGGASAMLAYDAFVWLAPLPLGWLLRPLSPFVLRPPGEPLNMAFNLGLGMAYLAAPQFLLAALAGWFHRRYRLRLAIGGRKPVALVIERREPVADADRVPTGVREGQELPVRG